jgi:alpha-1,2-mannosyltransferase
MSARTSERHEAVARAGWFRGRPWLAPLLLLVGLLVIYVPTVSQPDKTINDALANSAGAWRIATSGTPWFDGIGVPNRVAEFQYGVGAEGHVVIERTPGQILLAVPFYLFSSPDIATFSPFRGGVAAAFMTALAMMLLYLATRTALGSRVAMVGVIILALTTPVWSISADALWTHPVTLLGICGAAWAASRDRWWLAGVFLGLGILARPHEALIAATLGLGMTLARRDFRPVLGVGIPSAIAMGLLSLWNHLVLGTWDPRGSYSGRDYARLIPGESGGYLHNVLGWFFGWDYGWVWWTPLLFLMIPALVMGWRHAPWWVRTLALGGLVYMFAQIGLNGYTGGRGFWGYRLALEPLVCLAPLALFSYRSSARLWLRRAVPWVTALQFAIISLGAIDVPLDVMSVDGFEWEPNPIYLLVRDYPAAMLPLLAALALAWLLVWRLVSRRVARLPAEG